MRGGLTLAPSQREALRLPAASKALIITGGPGIGKTTLVDPILKMLVAKSVAVALCAPKGRAAKRLTESTGVEAKTIHRLLETDPKNGGFKRDEANPLPCDLLVVDETSMVDVLLVKALLRAVPTRAALLLVGDVDQLPSVDPGQMGLPPFSWFLLTLRGVQSRRAIWRRGSPRASCCSARAYTRKVSKNHRTGQPQRVSGPASRT